MPIHKITNTLTGMLDMSPLCDVLERTLTLKARESREVTEKTFTHDIVQRVLKAGWLKEDEADPAPEPDATPPEAHASDDLVPPDDVPPDDAPPPVADDLNVTSMSSAAQEEIPSEPVAVVESSTMPVETPVITETPMTPPLSNVSTTSSNKSNKRR